MIALSLLKKIDWYGPNINFRIKKEEKYKTILGGIFSLISFILFIYFFAIFGSDFFFKTNPTLIFQSIESKNYNNFTLHKENFFLGWRIYDDEANFINITDYFNLNIILKELTDDDSNEIQLNFTSCEDTIKNKSSPYYYDRRIDSLSCLSLPYEKNDDLFIGGYWNTGYIKYLSYELTPRVFNQIEKESFFKSNFYQKFKDNKIQFEYIFPESFFEVRNYSYPLKPNLIPHFSILSNKMSHQEDIFFGKTLVQADYGSIFEQIKDFTNVGYFRSNVMSGSFEENSFDSDFVKNDLVYYMIYFFFDKKENIITRKYMKIQELFGNIIGFMEILVILMEVVFDFFIEFHLSKYISNTLVHIVKNDEKPCKIKSLMSLKIPNNLDERKSNFKSIYKNVFVDKIEEFKKSNSFIEKNSIKLDTKENENELWNKKTILNINNVNIFTENDLNLLNNKSKRNYDDKNVELRNNLDKIINNNFYKDKKILKENDIFSKKNVFDLNQENIKSFISQRKIDDPIYNQSINQIFNKNHIEKLKFSRNKKIKLFDFNIFAFYSKGKCCINKKHQYDNKIKNVEFSEKINDLIMEKLDIFYYFKLSNEIRFVKYLLFDENQDSIIKYLSEKCCFLNHYRNEKVLKMNKLTEDDEFNHSLEIQNIEFIESFSPINRKINQILKGLLEIN